MEEKYSWNLCRKLLDYRGVLKMDNIPFNKHLVDKVAILLHNKWSHDASLLGGENTNIGAQWGDLPEHIKDVNRVEAKKILSAIFDGGL